MRDAYSENLLQILNHNMNKAYRELCNALEDFSSHQQEYQAELPESETELLNASRVVKFEVIHTADMMDKMSLIMLKQGKQIEEQAKSLKELRNLINKDGGDQIEEVPAVAEVQEPHPDDEIPALFSLRRSPYYQGKIAAMNLNHSILRTKRNLKRKMAQKSDF